MTADKVKKWGGKTTEVSSGEEAAGSRSYLHEAERVAGWGDPPLGKEFPLWKNRASGLSRSHTLTWADWPAQTAGVSGLRGWTGQGSLYRWGSDRHLLWPAAWERCSRFAEFAAGRDGQQYTKRRSQQGKHWSLLLVLWSLPCLILSYNFYAF